MNGAAVTSLSARYLDWFFVLVLLAVASAAVRWARVDSRQASEQAPAGQSQAPPWAVSMPLFIVAASLVVAALGTAVGEDYWELRSFVLVFVLWALSFMLYAGVLMLWPQGGDEGAGQVRVLIGLVLTSLSLLLPVLFGRASPESASQFSHGWFLLVAVSVTCILSGVLKGHSHRFPKFAAGLGMLQLVGWGLTELCFASPSFPWLIRIWNLTLPADYIASFPTAPTWRVAGAVKVLVGTAALATLLINSRRRRSGPA